MSVPEGSLPVFSVDTEEEAKQLIIAACPFDGGHYIAYELAVEQTLESLKAFSVRLAETWFDKIGREPFRGAEER